ncbi:hypothetical protein MRB53_040187 [Persea americana]|nr:hypothetical protein MRB53_040187 [Persea americana]
MISLAGTRIEQRAAGICFDIGFCEVWQMMVLHPFNRFEMTAFQDLLGQDSSVLTRSTSYRHTFAFACRSNALTVRLGNR